MVLLAKDGVYAGSISISDTIKPEASAAIASLKKMGIQTAMLTGDSEAAANAVASSTGIDRVYAKLLPGDKLDLLQNLRKAVFADSGVAMLCVLNSIRVLYKKN